MNRSSANLPRRSSGCRARRSSSRRGGSAGSTPRPERSSGISHRNNSGFWPITMTRNLLTRPHPYPGRLVVVEGIDGSGKSTQLQLLQKWLLSNNYRVFFTEWNSSALVKQTIKRGKNKNLLTPTTFSILHATDFADR